MPIKLKQIQELNIPRLRIVNDNAISGPTFSTRSECDLRFLRDCGITDIVDFRADAQKEFATLCRKNSIGYFNFPLDNVLGLDNQNFFIKEKNKPMQITPKFIELLQKFFAKTNQGQVYMGCQYGVDRTNMGLMLNFLLNRKNNFAPEVLTWPGERKKSVINKYVKTIKKIFKHLTTDQKHRLNLPTDSRKFLDTKIGQLLAKNRVISTHF